MTPDTYSVRSHCNPSPNGPQVHHVVSTRYPGNGDSSELRGHGHYRDALALSTSDAGEALDHASILNEFSCNTGFHWRDGRHFKRLDDGRVAIIDWQVDYYDPEHGYRTPKIVSVIPPNEWASIVSSVSAGGETGERYGQALAFHGTLP